MVRQPQVCGISVGRTAPRQALLDALGATMRGGALLFVGGDAGIGKSRLVRELKQEAVARGVRVVEGRCSSTETSVPYAPFMDALRFRLTRGEGDAVSRALGPLAGLLAPLFPELASAATAAPGDHPSRPFGPIYQVLERLASEDPMVLILEDVHWADPTSIEILDLLARRIGMLRLLVVATYRSDELHAAHPLRRHLAMLLRDRVAGHIALDPLDRDETGAMLRCILGREPAASFVDAVWRRTEGNPFFVEELLTALAEQGVRADEDATAALERLRLPATVRESVLARVHALGARALEVLSVAAVAGRRVEFEVLRQALDLSELELVDILEELVAHQLLREEHAGEEYYAFPHALMQEALYDNVISRRRRILHRRIAEALEAGGERRAPAHLDRLAYHFRLGGDHERAYAYSRRAGEEAARLHAWDDAVAHYERALAALEAIHDDGARSAELLERLSDVAWRRSTADESRQYAEEALRLRRALGDRRAAAALLRRLAEQLLERENDHEGAERCLREALEMLEDEPAASELAAVHDDLGRLAIARGDLDDAAALLQRALVHAGQGGDTAEEVLALISFGEIALRRGEREAALARLALAFEILRDDTLPPDRTARAFAAGLNGLIMAHEYGCALQWAEAGAAVSRRHGLVGMHSLFDAYVAAVHAVTGVGDPLPAATSAVAALRDADRPELREALRVLGFVQRIRGNLPAARAAYEEAARLGDRGVAVGLALVALDEGQAEEAAAVLETRVRAAPRADCLLRLRLLPHAVRALVRAGHAERGAALVAAMPADSADEPEVRFATAVLEDHAGRWQSAAQAFGDAADGWEQRGNLVEATAARAARVELLLRHPQAVDEGRALGRSLLDDDRASAFHAELERVRRALRRAGVRIRPNVPPVARADALLTSREETVLREVAKGRTNREIAAVLGIAEKTVSVHVSHILAKLGCRTRTQAARFVPLTG